MTEETLSGQTGRCMCGAVGFTADEVPVKFGVCHCEMCRRWTGSALLGVTIPEGKIVWTGEENIARLQSSAWAERAWCSKCGTGLYFRVTMESAYSGSFELPIGLFDNADGFEMTHEIFIDQKPHSFAYAGTGRKLMTRQDCVEKFGLLDEK